MKITLAPEMVLLKQNVVRVGDEITERGIVIGRATQGSVPEFGEIIQVADDCPEYVKKYIGLKTTIPTGKTMRVVSPDLVSGEIKAETNVAFTATHYKNIYVVYEDE